jgi:hypothetical protein
MTAVILNLWVPIDGCACASGDANAPVNTSLPVISGTVAVGQILTCSAGVWDGIPTTFVYQWQRDGANIGGATHSTYTLVLADSLHAIRCVVSAINIFAATSATATAVNVPYPAPISLTPPAVVGTAKVGQTLTCSTGAWDNSPTAYTFQWLRNGVLNIGTGSTYVAVDADDGQSISCIVTASSPGGIVSATSNSVAISRFAPTNTATPAISGLPFAGATFTCTQGAWTDAPTGYAYQWLRDSTAISGATSPTYVAAVADQGHSLSCEVTATNSGGSTSANSNAIALAQPFVFPAANLSALYSLRRVGSGYAGKCLTVRRTSDNTTLDIGFALNGTVDMAAATAFAAGSQLFVPKWYDQSGNGRDVSQATLLNQPQLQLIDGTPYLSLGQVQNSPGLGQTLSAAGPLALTGDQTIGVVSHVASDIAQIPVNCFDGTNGWFLTLNGTGDGLTPGSNPGAFTYFTPASGVVTDASNLYAQSPNRVVVSRASGAVTLYVNGTQTHTGAGSNSAATTPLQIGGYTHPGSGFGCDGLIGEVFAYAAALATADRTAIDANQVTAFPALSFPTPYSGAAWVQFGISENVSFGNILDFEYTQPWTMFAAMQAYQAPAGSCIIQVNVTATNDQGYGFEIGPDGRLRIRIIHSVPGAQWIDVFGSTVVADGRKHFLAASYSGSGLASGCQIYVDGVPETMTVASDTLGGLTIIGAGQVFELGNQVVDDPQANFRGCLGRFQLDGVVRSAAYIATYSTPSALPPIDANTLLSVALTEGAGTTAHDASTGAHNGALKTSTMWVP